MIRNLKKIAGLAMIFFGIIINWVLAGNFPMKIITINNHVNISSIMEIMLLIVGSLLLFAPDQITFNIFSKNKKQIGLALFFLGIIFNPIIANFLFVKNLKIQSVSFFAIFIFEILLIFMGGTMFLRPELITFKTIARKKKEFALLFVCLLATDFLLSFLVPPAHKQMNAYGWGQTSPWQETQKIQDKQGTFRDVTITYYNNGFKRWGNLSGSNKKILILGDSFTVDRYVSNGEEWYSYLEKAYPNVSFFVHGAGGFGSLQEYMVMNDNIDKINPDIILWQFCNVNDYTDNYYAYDKMWYGKNTMTFRPYLEGDKIVYRSPVPFSLLRQYSAISDKLLAVYDAEYSAFFRKNSIPRPNVSDKIKGEAYKVTEEILKKVSKRAGNRKIYMFNACGPITEKEKKLCKAANMTCIEGIWEGAEKMATKEDPVHPPKDAHWNLKGNKVAGEDLVDYFQKNGVFYK